MEHSNVRCTRSVTPHQKKNFINNDVFGRSKASRHVPRRFPPFFSFSLFTAPPTTSAPTLIYTLTRSCTPHLVDNWCMSLRLPRCFHTQPTPTTTTHLPSFSSLRSALSPASTTTSHKTMSSVHVGKNRVPGVLSAAASNKGVIMVCGAGNNSPSCYTCNTFCTTNALTPLL